MTGYTARRLASALLVVLGVTVATFLLLHVEPGDPARAVLGVHASPEAVAALRHRWGLDASLPSQFWRFIDQLVHGDLGTSYFLDASAASLIASSIGVSALLVAVATLFAVVITVPLATLAASRQNRLADHAVRALSVAGLGLPSFWFGIVLVEIFAVHLHVLPVGNFSGPFGHAVVSLVLPGLTASFAIVPILVRSLRVGMLDVLDADYVATARAKGIGEVRVLLAHVARNALIPTIALLGLNIAYLVGSTVVIEQVFNLHGLGMLLLQAISNRDFPVVQSVTLVLATAVVLINLATDLLAAALDPRVRLR